MLRKTREKNSKMEFSFQFTTANFRWGSKITFKRNTWRYEYCIFARFYLYLIPCNKTQTPSHTSHLYSFLCYWQLSRHLVLFHLAFASKKVWPEQRHGIYLLAQNYIMKSSYFKCSRICH